MWGLNLFKYALDALVVCFGTWTAYCHLLVYTGQDFHMLTRLSFVVPMISAVLLYLLWSAGGRAPVKAFDPPAAPSHLSSHWMIQVLVAGGIVGIYLVTKSLVIFWLFAVAYLAWVHWSGRGMALPHPTDGAAEPKWTPLVLLILMLAAMFVTWHARWPDLDDAF